MMATKLNAQVTIKNLQNMHEKPLIFLPPTGARRRMEGQVGQVRSGQVYYSARV